MNGAACPPWMSVVSSLWRLQPYPLIVLERLPVQQIQHRVALVLVVLVTGRQVEQEFLRRLSVIQSMLGDAAGRGQARHAASGWVSRSAVGVIVLVAVAGAGVAVGLGVASAEQALRPAASSAAAMKR